MNKREYKQNCSLALASDLLGERWTLLILRELMIQPCRFKMLNTFLKGMGTNLLTSRLKELEESGLVTRENSEDKRSAYILTTKGRSTEPMLMEMIRWGLINTSSQEGFSHFHHWDLLALKALFNPGNLSEPVTVHFKTEDFEAWVAVTNEACEFGLGAPFSSSTIYQGTLQQLQRAVLNNERLQPELEMFISCFTMPDNI